jgi:autotransporter-associated beta strand protein
VQVVDDTPPFVWNGGGGDDNWRTAENWNAGSPKDGSKLTFGGTNRRTNHNDLLQRVGVVKFNAGGFYVDGNPVVLAAGLSSIGDNTWAINSTLGGKQTLANMSRTLILAESINTKGYDLTLLANDTLRLEGVLMGTGGLTKSGPGKLVMTASNSYTGPTVINSGTLLLTNAGAISRSASITIAEGAALDIRGLTSGFTVASGQTLKGLGTVMGPPLLQFLFPGRSTNQPSVTILGTLAPDLPLGPSFPSTASRTLTFSNRLVLAGDTVLQLPRAGEEGAEILRVTTELQCGGRLIVKNSESAPAPAFTNTFKLFSAARVTGAFASFDLPPLRPGLQWDTSQLAVDGTLRVGAASPRILPVVSGGESITIRFQTLPGLTYVLESTSSLAPPVTWTNVGTRVGSGGLGAFVVLVQPATTQRFFRVRAN